MLKVHAKNLGNVAVLSLRGRIVNGETEILRHAVDSVSDGKSVILDLAKVSTIDAGGLGVMLDLRRQAEARGVRFELMNVTKWVSRVLEVTRLDTVFEINSRVASFSVSRGRRAPVTALASCA